MLVRRSVSVGGEGLGVGQERLDSVKRKMVEEVEGVEEVEEV